MSSMLNLKMKNFSKLKINTKLKEPNLKANVEPVEVYIIEKFPTFLKSFKEKCSKEIFQIFLLGRHSNHLLLFSIFTIPTMFSPFKRSS